MVRTKLAGSIRKHEMPKKQSEVINATSDRPLRLRKALLGKTTDCTSVGAVTSDDVKAKWPLLMQSGLCCRDIVSLANSHDIEPQIFERLMTNLYSSL